MNKNKRYLVEGDLTAERSSDNYQEKALCAECVGSYTIQKEGKPTDEACEDCGAPDSM